jgi:hypothetical protein
MNIEVIELKKVLSIRVTGAHARTVTFAVIRIEAQYRMPARNVMLGLTVAVLMPVDVMSIPVADVKSSYGIEIPSITCVL